jgi:hypothetical protein
MMALVKQDQANAALSEAVERRERGSVQDS